MALDIPTPWVHGPNVAEAISSGAAAGEGAARINLQRDESSARLAQDAIQHNQQIQAESARLSQQEHIAQMEMQARKEVSQQNQLRDQQRLAITAAYHQAQIGVEKGRLEQQQAVAQAKAKEAAAAFQREQSFASDVASGVPVMDAFRKNPVSPSVLSAIGRTQLKEDTAAKPVLREGKFPLIEYDPKTGTTRQVYTPPTPAGLSAADKEDLKDLRHERDTLTKKMGDPLSERIAPTPPEERKANEDRLNLLNKQIDSIKRGSKTSSESKFGHPKVGEVRFGHRFKGGDPNEQNNWEPVKEGE
jgi:hypothetical protein